MARRYLRSYIDYVTYLDKHVLEYRGEREGDFFLKIKIIKIKINKKIRDAPPRTHGRYAAQKQRQKQKAETDKMAGWLATLDLAPGPLSHIQPARSYHEKIR